MHSIDSDIPDQHPGQATPLGAYMPHPPAQISSAEAEQVDPLDANWMRAVQELQAQRPEQAREWLNSAVQRDPSQFDVWLALHMLQPDDDTLLDRMFETASTDGQMRAKTPSDHVINSTYSLTEHLKIRLSSRHDVHYAQAARYLREQNYEKALDWIRRLPAAQQSSSQSFLLRAQVAMQQEQYFAALQLLQRIPTTLTTLLPDKLRLTGMILRRQGQLMGALQALSHAFGQQTSIAARHEVQYEMGLTHEALGNEQGYLSCMQGIYADDIAYRDVRERLFPDQEDEWRFQEQGVLGFDDPAASEPS